MIRANLVFYCHLLCGSLEVLSNLERNVQGVIFSSIGSLLRHTLRGKG
jgi:hypothetical protein